MPISKCHTKWSVISCSPLFTRLRNVSLNAKCYVLRLKLSVLLSGLINTVHLPLIFQINLLIFLFKLSFWKYGKPTWCMRLRSVRLHPQPRIVVCTRSHGSAVDFLSVTVSTQLMFVDVEFSSTFHLVVARANLSAIYAPPVSFLHYGRWCPSNVIARLIWSNTRTRKFCFDSYFDAFFVLSGMLSPSSPRFHFVHVNWIMPSVMLSLFWILSY